MIGFGQISGGDNVPSEGMAQSPAPREDLQTEGVGTPEEFSPAQQQFSE